MARIAVVLVMAATVAVGSTVTTTAGKASTSTVAKHGRPHHRSVRCQEARRAVVFFRGAFTRWRAAVGERGAEDAIRPACWHLRRAALAWRARARAAWRAAEEAARRRRLEWAAPPEPYLSIARCEQRGSGLWGVNWQAYSSSYEGAYGFLHSTWRENRYPWMPSQANLATAREQTLVAMRLQRKYGWSPWPACHIRLGLG